MLELRSSPPALLDDEDEDEEGDRTELLEKGVEGIESDVRRHEASMAAGSLGLGGVTSWRKDIFEGSSLLSSDDDGGLDDDA